MSLVCHSCVIHMSLVCTRMLLSFVFTMNRFITVLLFFFVLSLIKELRIQVPIDSFVTLFYGSSQNHNLHKAIV